MLHEHQRFAERIPGRDDFDDLFASLGGDERQLDLSVDDEVEALAGIAAIEDDFAARDVEHGRARGDALELGRREFLE